MSGMLALWHSCFHGFIPCRVLARVTVTDWHGQRETRALIRLTAARGPWARGEIMTVDRADICARPARRIRGTYGRMTASPLSTVMWESLPLRD